MDEIYRKRGKFTRKCANPKHDEWAAIYNKREFLRMPISKCRNDIRQCFQAFSKDIVLTSSSYFCPGCLKYADERPEIKNQCHYRGKTSTEQRRNEVLSKTLIPVSNDRSEFDEPILSCTLTTDKQATVESSNNNVKSSLTNSFQLENLPCRPSTSSEITIQESNNLESLLPPPVKKLKLGSDKFDIEALQNMSKDEILIHLGEREKYISKLEEHTSEIYSNNYKTRNEVKQLLSTTEKRAQVAGLIGKLENNLLLEETQELVAQTERKNIPNMLKYDSKESFETKNKVLCTFIKNITSSDTEKGKGLTLGLQGSFGDIAKKKTALRNHAAEMCLAARNLRYNSEFAVAVQSVLYSITQSRLAVDLVGHFTAGCSYEMIRNIISSSGKTSSSLSPPGVLEYAFDNNQRLMKLYLSRFNKPLLDIMTNIICVQLDEKDLSQENVSFCPDRWPSVQQILNESHCSLSGLSLEMKEIHEAHIRNIISNVIKQLLQNGINDDVQKKTLEEQQKMKKHCPMCKEALPSRQSRNCRNDKCSLYKQNVNIYGEPSNRSKAVENRLESRRKEQSDFKIRFHDNSYVLKNNSLNEKSDHKAHPIKVQLVDPVFVNPASEEAIKTVLRHIGKHAKVKKYCEDGTRHWVFLTCDGSPYSTVRKILNETKMANGSLEFDWIILRVGVLHEEMNMLKSFVELNWEISFSDFGLTQNFKSDKAQQLLKKCGDHHRSWDDFLKFRDGMWEELIYPYVCEYLSGNLNSTEVKQLYEPKPHHVIHEFYPLMPGSFTQFPHKNVVKQRVNSLVPPGLFSSQVQFAPPCKFQSVTQTTINHPSSEGFLHWCTNKSFDSTYKLNLEIMINYAESIVLFRQGVRNNNTLELRTGRRIFSPLWSGRNHPKYKFIELWDEIDRLRYPPKICQLVNKFEAISRSGRASAHQGTDAVLEEMNKSVKHWISGLPSASAWESVVRNHDDLVELRKLVFSSLSLKDPESVERRRPDYYEEKLSWRAKLRSENYLTPRPRCLQALSSTTVLEQSLTDFTVNSEQRRKQLISNYFCKNIFPNSKGCGPPLFVTMKERENHESIERQSNPVIKKEIENIISALPLQKLKVHFQTLLNSCKGKNRKQKLLAVFYEVSECAKQEADEVESMSE